MTSPDDPLLGPTGPVVTPDDDPGTPVLERHGDDFTVRWKDQRVELALTAIRESSEGVHAELAVVHDGADIHLSRVNLLSTSSLETVVKKLMAMAADVPWRSMLGRAARDTARVIRRGTPTIQLRARQQPAADQYLIEPILPLGETAVLFGDGGAGKGFTAIALALAGLTGVALPGGVHASRKVRAALYCDWETTPSELEDRLYLLSRGLGCSAEGLHYRRMSRALADEVAMLRSEVSRLSIGLVIVDSLGPACGAEPEGADAAVRTMNALRSLGPVTRLVIAHVSKIAADQRTGPARPYGSVYVRNLARSAWEIRRSDDGGEDLVVGLYHNKVNRGRQLQPIGLRFTFGDDRITLHHANLGEMPELLARASLPQQIRAALTSGAKTTSVLATELDAKEDSVKKTLQRLRNRSIVVQLPGDKPPYLWGLAQRS